MNFSNYVRWAIDWCSATCAITETRTYTHGHTHTHTHTHRERERQTDRQIEIPYACDGQSHVQWSYLWQQWLPAVCKRTLEGRKEEGRMYWRRWTGWLTRSWTPVRASSSVTAASLGRVMKRNAPPTRTRTDLANNLRRSWIIHICRSDGRTTATAVHGVPHALRVCIRAETGTTMLLRPTWNGQVLALLAAFSRLSSDYRLSFPLTLLPGWFYCCLQNDIDTLITSR